MNINFELFKVFVEVAKQKSISKGAEKLCISQPAVTQSIQTLENELGGKLFVRTPRGVVLTKEGEELYGFISDGMSYFINGTNKFMSLKNLESGVLNIGSTTSISENYLIPYLEKFHQLYPLVTINITNDLTDNLLKELRNGSLDIVIVAIPKYEIKDLKISKICDLNDIFVCGSSYVNNKYSDLYSVLKEGIIVQKRPSVTRSNFDLFLKEKEIIFNPKMEVVSHSLLTKLVESNFGIGLVTKEFVSDKLNKTLFELKIDTNLPKRELGYVIKNETYPSFTTKKFIEILKSDN